MEWLGMLCLDCRAENDFVADRDRMGLWCFLDIPEVTFVSLCCKKCGNYSILYLGESWLEDSEYIVEQGVGVSVIDEAPDHAIKGFIQTFGFRPLSASELHEVAFERYRMEVLNSAEISLTEWEEMYGTVAGDAADTAGEVAGDPGEAADPSGEARDPDARDRAAGE